MGVLDGISNAIDGTVETFNRGVGVAEQTAEQTIEDTTGIDYDWTGVDAGDAGLIAMGPTGWAFLAGESHADDVADSVADTVGGAMSHGPIDTVIDTVWSGHEGDTIDLIGPAAWGQEGSVADVAVEEDGESHEGELGTTLFLVALVAIVGLWLLRPLLEIGAEVASGE
ncbi:hypothetical protein ELS19_01340 [Halogeometricum borinquense]|uniref:Uncharacterized protein n=1 Tax=Halogeometricum borinquense TaxID=60847 RepID=A0A482T514_9EURY|nr:hypothetical protein [Halogeometricum borinquense]RYJ12744.1 hypothetical protein ELS19_01340 [Halogeometricum borinquense]